MEIIIVIYSNIHIQLELSCVTNITDLMLYSQYNNFMELNHLQLTNVIGLSFMIIIVTEILNI